MEKVNYNMVDHVPFTSINENVEVFSLSLYLSIFYLELSHHNLMARTFDLVGFFVLKFKMLSVEVFSLAFKLSFETV